MSKAPEWIYLDGDVEAGDGMFPRCFENPKYASEPQVEYVRVDLAEAAEQQGYASAMEDARKLHEARIEELKAKLAKATELLIHSTEENLWNAYHSGHCDEADAWTHMFMSDGEWLVREIGLDPEQARYDAEEIRDSIPATARKIVLAELTGGKDE